MRFGGTWPMKAPAEDVYFKMPLLLRKMTVNTTPAMSPKKHIQKAQQMAAWRFFFRVCFSSQESL
jgi:hypothetical protein